MNQANAAQLHTERFTLEPNDTKRLANVCGHLDTHVKQVADHFRVKIFNRSNEFQISGEPSSVKAASDIIERLYRQTNDGSQITPDLVHLLLVEASAQLSEQAPKKKSGSSGPVVIKTPNALIRPRGENQQGYVSIIRQHDINFGIGPAGTGKTYLAVACAVEALMKDEVQRILLVRPAVEAGEKLGFLPGDLAQKVDPYLRPLYDALNEMMGYEQVAKLIERNVIEIAPLAYMRGRTLSNSYVILDESQNTTREQMKMFLTRIGFGSKAVITGDITQVDLPRGTYSGLRHALRILDNVPGIGMTKFANKDVVRHPLVQKIVEAYDKFEGSEQNKRNESRDSQERTE